MIIDWLLGIAIVVTIGALVTIVVSLIIMCKCNLDINEELTTHSPMFKGAHHVFEGACDTLTFSAILAVIFAVYRAYLQ